MTAEFACAAVLGHDHHDKGFRIAALHAGRAHGHAWHCEAQDIGLLVEEAEDVLCRHVAVNHISTDLSEVAASERFRHAELAAPGGKIRIVAHADLKSRLPQVLDPKLATAAAGIAVSGHIGKRGSASAGAGEGKKEEAKKAKSEDISPVHLFRLPASNGRVKSRQREAWLCVNDQGNGKEASLLKPIGRRAPEPAVDAIRKVAVELSGSARDYDALLDRIGDAHYVLLGEASHGTHEFYRERAEITKRLIGEKGFSAVLVEADWPDAFRVNRYVRGGSNDSDAIEALADFRRFPSWMWQNTAVAEFVEWLRSFNDALSGRRRNGGFLRTRSL